MKRLGILIASLMTMMLVSPAVLASDITDALYYGIIAISNNGTAASGVSTNCTINTQALIDGGYINSATNNTAIRNVMGADVAFMPGASSNPWVMWVPSMDANSYMTYLLYTNATGGKIRYFPAAGGMTTSDNASLELSDNFTIEVSGWIDTDNGTDKNLVYKQSALRVFVSDLVSENITAAISESDDFVTDEWTDVGTKIVVNTTTETLEYESERSAVDNRCYIDLGLQSDTSWQLDFTFSNNTSAGTAFFLFGLFETADNISEYAGDAIAFLIHTATPEVKIEKWDEGTGEVSSAITITDGVTYYATLERLASDNVSISLYSDSARTTHIAGSPVNYAVDTTIQNLRYLQAANLGDGNDAAEEQIGWIDDVYIDDLPAKISVSATGVSSGEHTIRVTANSTASDTQTVRPNADYVLNLDASGSPHYAEIDEPDPPNDADWVKGPTAAYKYDLFEIPNLSKLGGITSITVYWRAQGAASTGKAAIYTNSTIYYGAEESLTGAHVNYDHTWATNPATSVNWTRSEIDGLRIGVALASPGAYVYCSQIYAIITLNQSLSLYIDNVLAGATTGASVPDNSENWTFLQNNVMPYMEYHKIWVGGTLQQHIEWEYTTGNFTDLSGNSHDAAPTFRTTSSDADISALLTSFNPVEEANAPAYSLSEASPFITSTPTVTGNFTTTIVPTFPAKELIDAVAAAGNTPAQLPYIIMAGFGIIGSSLALSWMLRKYGSGSLSVKILVIVAIMGTLIAVKLLDFWMIVIFIIIALALAMASRQRAW